RTRALTNVNIGARRHRVVASVQFEDNGPGVPEQLRETLFYPLVTGRSDGTGLGLAIAQELVARHDGLIEFESRPGRTVFTILLPFNASDVSETAYRLARRRRCLNPLGPREGAAPGRYVADRVRSSGHCARSIA